MDTENKPWIADGSESAEHEDHLIGNAEGFRILRDSLDKAIKDGRAEIDDGGVCSPWVGITMIEKNPFPSKPMGRIQEKLMAIGCIAVVVIALILLSLGLMKLGEWVK